MDKYLVEQISKILIPATGAIDLSSKHVADSLLKIGSKSNWLKFHSIGIFMMGCGTFFIGLTSMVSVYSFYRCDKRKWFQL